MKMDKDLILKVWKYKNKHGTPWTVISHRMGLDIDWQTVQSYCYRFKNGKIFNDAKIPNHNPRRNDDNNNADHWNCILYNRRLSYNTDIRPFQ